MKEKRREGKRRRIRDHVYISSIATTTANYIAGAIFSPCSRIEATFGQSNGKIYFNTEEGADAAQQVRQT